MPIPWMDGNSGTETIIVPAIWTSRTRRPARPGRYEVNWASPLTRGLVGLWLFCYDRYYPNLCNLNPRYAKEDGTFLSGRADDFPTAKLFDGSSYTIEIDANNYYDGTTFTVLCHCKILEKRGDAPTILSKRDVWDGMDWEVFWHEYGSPETRLSLWVAQQELITDAVYCPTLKWVHVAVLRNGSLWSLDVDGSRASASTSATIGNDKIRLAKISSGSTPNNVKGYYQSLSIWNRKLDDQELQEIRDQTRYGSYGDLVRLVPERKYVYVSVPTSPLLVPAIQTSKTRRPARPGRYEVNWASPLTRGLRVFWAGFDRVPGRGLVGNGDTAVQYVPGTSSYLLAKHSIIDGRLCVDFDGYDDKLSGGYPDWNGNDPITFLVWTKARSAKDSICFGMSSADKKRLLTSVPWGDGVCYFDYGDHTGAGRIYADYSAYIGKWTMVCGQSRGALGTGMRLWFNDTIAATTSQSMGTATAQFQVGGDPVRPEVHNGPIACILLWNRWLEDAEILELYNQTRYGGYGDLVRPVPERRYVFVSAPPRKPKEMIIVRRRRRM